MPHKTKTRRLKKFTFLPALILVIITGVVFLQRSFAAGGFLVLAPSSTSVQQNNTFSVGLQVSPRQDIDGVDVTLTFDATKVRLDSYTGSPQPFDTEYYKNISGGTLRTVRLRATSGYVNADNSAIGTANFTALAGSGNTTLTLSGTGSYNGQAITLANATSSISFSTPPPVDSTGPVVSITSPHNGDTVAKALAVSVSASDSTTGNSGIQKVELYLDGNLAQTVGTAPYNFSVTVGSGAHTLKATAYDNSSNHNATSSSISITGPADTITPPPSGGGGGGTSGGGTSTGSGSTTVKGGTTNVPAPQQLGSVTVKAHSIQFTLASFDLTSDKRFSAYIEYGLDNSLGWTTPTTGSGTSQLITLDSNLLIPGTSFSYRVTTIDASGKKTQSDIQTFKTQGFTVKVTALDQAHKALHKKDLTLHSDPIIAQTDSHGTATFTDVAPGAHDVQYNHGKTYSKQVQVQNNVETNGDTQTAPVQNISIIYSDLKQASYTWVWIVVGIVAFLIIAWAITQYRQHSGPFGGGGDGALHGQVMVSGEASPAAPAAKKIKLPKLFKNASAPKDANIWTDQSTSSNPTVTPPIQPTNDQASDQNKDNDQSA